MRTRYEAWLNKESLSAIDPSIMILDIAYGEPRFTQVLSDKPGRPGQHLTNRLLRSAQVTISMEIHEQRIEKRQNVCELVNRWAAKGGLLTTNDKRGKQLRVICESPPVIASALKWTQPVRLVFSAYEQPFWEDEYPVMEVLTGANAGASVYVPGIGAQTRAEVSVRNTSGDVLDALTVNAGGTTFDFEELGLADGETLEINHDENGLLRIRVGDVSKMACRTAESDDELLLTTGMWENVEVLAGGEVVATFKARGLYL